VSIDRRVGRVLAAALSAGTLAAPAAEAQRAPSFSVAVAPAAEQWRPLVAAVGILEDRALAEALDSGLPLRIRLRVELWRREVPDHLSGAREVARAVTRNALGPGYVLDDGRVQRELGTLAQVEAALRTAFDVPLRPGGPGRYYYLGTLEVATLSLTDLDELRLWLRGETVPAAEGQRPVGRAVERGLQRVLVRLLRLPTRRYAARSEVFAVP
jgi:hypothetical protein